MIDPDKLKCGQIEAKLKLKQLFLIKNVKENCEKWSNDISHQLCFPNYIHTVLGKSNRIKKLAAFLPVKLCHKTGRSGPVTENFTGSKYELKILCIVYAVSLIKVTITSRCY